MTAGLKTTTVYTQNTEFAIATFLKRNADFYINSKKKTTKIFRKQNIPLRFSTLGERMRKKFVASIRCIIKGPPRKHSGSTEVNTMEI